MLPKYHLHKHINTRHQNLLRRKIKDNLNCSRLPTFTFAEVCFLLEFVLGVFSERCSSFFDFEADFSEETVSYIIKDDKNFMLDSFSI